MAEQVSPPGEPEISRTLVQRAHTRTVAENLVETYGVERFAELVDDLTTGKHIPEIAARFGVSRQRVYQWRDSLGFVVQVWTARPEILRLVDE